MWHIIILCLSLANATVCPGQQQRQECPVECLKRPSESVNLIADVGFFSFAFGQGNAGNYANQFFTFNFPYRTRFLLTDCLCGGDSFIALDTTTTSGTVGLEIPATKSCLKTDTTCRYFSYDPQECAFTDGWCHSDWTWLNPGPHNITIEILTAPFRCGTGYVILQTICQDRFGYFYVCCEADNSCVYSIYQ